MMSEETPALHLCTKNASKFFIIHPDDYKLISEKAKQIEGFN